MKGGKETERSGVYKLEAEAETKSKATSHGLTHHD